MKDQAKIKKILEYKSIAVVGFSPKEERPSNYVSMYMQKNDYLITPVNPGHQHIGNLKCYPSLESVDHPIDIVNVFRKSEFVYYIVKSSILPTSEVSECKEINNGNSSSRTEDLLAPVISVRRLIMLLRP